jgi:hypothetical protein
VLRADRVVDGLAFATCTVGGTDATDAIAELWSDLGRPDVRYLLIAGVAPAWYNVLDIDILHQSVDRPVLAVTFEASDESLDEALSRAFSGEAFETRLERFERLPPRSRLRVNGETVFVRSVGCETSEARDVVRAFTPEGGRPEPLRVARMAARAGRALLGDGPEGEDRNESGDEHEDEPV